MGHGDAQAVAVGVGGEEEVSLRLLAELEAELKRLAHLWVGVRAGRERPVLHGLLLDHADVGHADLGEGPGDALQAHAVQRRVHDAQARTVHAGRLGGRQVDELLDDCLVDGERKAACHGFVVGHGPHVFERVHGVNGRLDCLGRRHRDLATVRAVDLVAVVGGRIVARGDVDARRAPQLAHGEAEGGRGLHALVHVCLDSVGRQHRRRAAHELLAAVARIAAQGNRRALKVRVQPVCEALRGLAHGVGVNAVGPQAQLAAQAASAEC